MASPVFASGTFNKSATLTQRREGYRNDVGRYVTGPETTTPITVIVQPVDEHREDIVGGARLVGAMYFYTEPIAAVQELRVADDPSDPAQSYGDIITYPVNSGTEYRALAKVVWPDYVRITAVRVEGQ